MSESSLDFFVVMITNHTHVKHVYPRRRGARPGVAGGGGALLPPMISVFLVYYRVLLVCSAVMSMMIIPLPHYDNFGDKI